MSLGDDWRFIAECSRTDVWLSVTGGPATISGLFEPAAIEQLAAALQAAAAQARAAKAELDAATANAEGAA